MPRRYVWTIIAALIVSLASGPSAMLYAQRTAGYAADQAEQRAKQTSYENEQKWCSVVGTIHQSYVEQPPTLAAGKNLATAIAELYEDLRCPPTLRK
jgi:hypothetical protein